MVRLVKGAYWDSEIKRAQERGLAELPGLHPQGRDRRLLSRLRPAAVRGARRVLSAIRDPQRAHRRRGAASCAGERQRLRVPAPARHGRGAVRRWCADDAAIAVPRLRAGRQPRGSAAPIWCGGCWRTAPTPPSSTASSTSAADRARSSPTRSPRWRGWPAQAASRASRCRAISIGRTRRNSRRHRSRRPRGARRAARGLAQRCGEPRAGRRPDRRRRRQSAARRAPVFDPADRRRQSATVVSRAPSASRRRSPRRRAPRRDWDAHAGGGARRDPRPRRRSLERDRAALMALLHPRGRQDHPRRAVARCARRPISCATTRRARAPISPSRWRCPARPASATARAARPRRLRLHRRRGISRWRSSPGQIAAALAAGNAVIAKPAEQTPLIAAAAVQLLHEAGIPGDVLHLLPGERRDGRRGAGGRPAHRRRRVHRLDRHGARDQPRARRAQRADRAADRRDRRAERDDRRFRRRCPSRWCDDALISAFDSAGQRCSALRVLLCRTTSPTATARRCSPGAMDELTIGDPALTLDRRRPGHRRGGASRARRPTPSAWARGPPAVSLRAAAGTEHGMFFAPRAFEIDSASQLDRRGVRPDPACRPLARRPARPGHRRDQRDRVRPDPRHPQPHRRHRAARARRGSASAMPMSTAT